MQTRSNFLESSFASVPIKSSARMWIAAASLMLSSACGTEVFDDVAAPAPQARNRAAQKAKDVNDQPKATKPNPSSKKESAPQPTPKTDRWVLNPKASRVQLIVLKATGQHIGRFESVFGNLQGDQSNWNELFVTIDTSSLKTDVPAFGAHVRSSVFLNVKKHPKAVFRTKNMKLKKSKESGATQMLRGDIEINGVQKPIELPIWIRSSASGPVEVSGHFNIRPSMFNMRLAPLAEELIDEVEIEIDLRFIRAK